MSGETATERAIIGNGAVLLILLLTAIGFARWQTDPWWIAAPDAGRWLAVGATVLLYAGLCITIWRRTRGERVALADASNGGDTLLVAWASQTGFAQQIAEHTAQALRGAGTMVNAMPLHAVDATVLCAHRRALFIASTTGEGDAPDHAQGFTRRVLGQPLALEGLQYAVLALGDRAYVRFCAFGRQLDHWLHHSGAQPLFDRIEVDAGDDGALRHWQHRLGQLAGHVELADWSAPDYRDWRLLERRWLNPGSSGGPAWHVALIPVEVAELDWQAGDIAEVGPRHSPAHVAQWLQEAGLPPDVSVRTALGEERLQDLAARSRLPVPAGLRSHDPQTVADTLEALPHREYSIASLPSEGSLHLLVRQMRDGIGRLGVGSGWLTEYAPVGSRIDLRIRRNPGFRVPADGRACILIGNGTGLAGLRALLKARISQGHHRNWLLFGERHREHDWHFRDEFEAWLGAGQLERLDLAFSREDPARKVYVQDRLREHVGLLREWIGNGASVFVCGSLEGMAPAVDAVLREAVGLDALESMAAEGRYCRDVY